MKKFATLSRNSFPFEMRAPALDKCLSKSLKPSILYCFSYYTKEPQIMVCIMAAKFSITLLISYYKYRIK